MNLLNAVLTIGGIVTFLAVLPWWLGVPAGAWLAWKLLR